MDVTGANSNSTGPLAATGHIDHFLLGRSSATAAFNGKGSGYGVTVDNVTGAPNLPIYILARNNSGGVGGRSDAALSAAAFFNTSIDSTEWDTFRGLVNAFNTTIGRAP